MVQEEFQMNAQDMTGEKKEEAGKRAARTRC